MNSKFSKILIALFLVLFVSTGFAAFHFSNAQNSENDVPLSEISSSDSVSLPTKYNQIWQTRLFNNPNPV